jgi:hypothetical protein
VTSRLATLFACIVTSILTITLSVADEWPIRQNQKTAPNLGPALSEAAPRPLTIRRPTATYLCPDPRDIGKHCPIIHAHSQIRLGPGAPNVLLRNSWLMPPSMPVIDYNQTPDRFVYHVTSALDQHSIGFDAKTPTFIFLRSRTSPPFFFAPPATFILPR